MLPSSDVNQCRLLHIHLRPSLNYKHSITLWMDLLWRLMYCVTLMLFQSNQLLKEYKLT